MARRRQQPADDLVSVLADARLDGARLPTLELLSYFQLSGVAGNEAARRYLAWESIVDEKEALNLDPHQARQAETQKNTADGAVTARLPEAYQWLLVPTQTSAQAPSAQSFIFVVNIVPPPMVDCRKMKNGAGFEFRAWHHVPQNIITPPLTWIVWPVM